jgi:hypothetical protein
MHPRFRLVNLDTNIDWSAGLFHFLRAKSLMLDPLIQDATELGFT